MLNIRSSLGGMVIGKPRVEHTTPPEAVHGKETRKVTAANDKEEI